VYARLNETYEAAESVPTQLDRGTGHGARRGCWVASLAASGFGMRGNRGPPTDSALRSWPTCALSSSANPAGNIKDKFMRRKREMTICGSASNSTGEFSFKLGRSIFAHLERWLLTLA
jgi:hypothetical protein